MPDLHAKFDAVMKPSKFHEAQKLYEKLSKEIPKKPSPTGVPKSFFEAQCIYTKHKFAGKAFKRENLKKMENITRLSLAKIEEKLSEVKDLTPEKKDELMRAMEKDDAVNQRWTEYVEANNKAARIGLDLIEARRTLITTVLGEVLSKFGTSAQPLGELHWGTELVVPARPVSLSLLAEMRKRLVRTRGSLKVHVYEAVYDAIKHILEHQKQQAKRPQQKQEACSNSKKRRV